MYVRRRASVGALLALLAFHKSVEIAWAVRPSQFVVADWRCQDRPLTPATPGLPLRPGNRRGLQHA